MYAHQIAVRECYEVNSQLFSPWNTTSGGFRFTVVNPSIYCQFFLIIWWGRNMHTPEDGLEKYLFDSIGLPCETRCPQGGGQKEIKHGCYPTRLSRQGDVKPGIRILFFKGYPPTCEGHTFFLRGTFVKTFSKKTELKILRGKNSPYLCL